MRWYAHLAAVSVPNDVVTAAWPMHRQPKGLCHRFYLLNAPIQRIGFHGIE